VHAINVGLRPTRDGVATPLRPALHLDILGSFVDILGSFLDILGSFLDILGSFLDNVGRLRPTRDGVVTPLRPALH